VLEKAIRSPQDSQNSALALFSREHFGQMIGPKAVADGDGGFA